MGQVSPPQKTEFPFNVATTQASRTLIRVHQYVRGELLKRDGDDDVPVSPEVCHQQMAAIETMLGFFGANFDPSALKPRRAYPKIGHLDYGQIRAGVLTALKGAGDWRTYNELADHIVALHKLERPRNASISFRSCARRRMLSSASVPWSVWAKSSSAMPSCQFCCAKLQPFEICESRTPWARHRPVVAISCHEVAHHILDVVLRHASKGNVRPRGGDPIGRVHRARRPIGALTAYPLLHQ